MVSPTVFMLAVVSFLVGSSIDLAVAYGYGQPAAEMIQVGGKVLCQDCTKGWNEWVHGAKPLKGN